MSSALEQYRAIRQRLEEEKREEEHYINYYTDGEGISYERTEEEKKIKRKMVEIKRRRDKCYMDNQDWLSFDAIMNATGKGSRLRKIFRNYILSGILVDRTIADDDDYRLEGVKIFVRCYKGFTREQRKIIEDDFVPAFLWKLRD